MSRPDKTTEATLRMLHAAPDTAPAIVRYGRRPHHGLSAVGLEREVPRDRIFERRKENDLSLEAFRDFLLKKGHKVD